MDPWKPLHSVDWNISLRSLTITLNGSYVHYEAKIWYFRMLQKVSCFRWEAHRLEYLVCKYNEAIRQNKRANKNIKLRKREKISPSSSRSIFKSMVFSINSLLLTLHSRMESQRGWTELSWIALGLWCIMPSLIRNSGRKLFRQPFTFEIVSFLALSRLLRHSTTGGRENLQISRISVFLARNVSMLLPNQRRRSFTKDRAPGYCLGTLFKAKATRSGTLNPKRW